MQPKFRKTIGVGLALVLLVVLGASQLQAQGILTLEDLAEKINILTGRIDALEDTQAQELEKLATTVASIEERLVQAESTPVPTLVPDPLSSAATIVTVMATATSTPTLTPTSTPIPDTVLVVTVNRGNVRSGPGTGYGVIATVQSGDILQGPLQETAGWYQFCCVNGEENGWISKSLVSLRQTEELTAWEEARNSAVEIDPKDLLRYNESHVGKLVYYNDAYVSQSLEDAILVYLKDDEYDDPLILSYQHTPLRILEGDIIEFVANVIGLYTYETAGQGMLTVPLLEVVELRLKEE